VSTIVAVLLGQPQVRGMLMASVLAAVIVGVWRAAHDKPWAAAAGLALSAGVIVAVTLYPLGIGGLGRARVAGCWSGFDLHRLLPDALGSPSGLANVALFVPFGFFLAWATSRVVRSAAVVVATTTAIEASQGLVLPGRDCSVADVLANTVGGLVGIAVAVLVGRTSP
jgi:hypothetical protein